MSASFLNTKEGSLGTEEGLVKVGDQPKGIPVWKMVTPIKLNVKGNYAYRR